MQRASSYCGSILMSRVPGIGCQPALLLPSRLRGNLSPPVQALKRKWPNGRSMSDAGKGLVDTGPLYMQLEM